MNGNTLKLLLEQTAHAAHHFLFKTVVTHVQQGDFRLKRSMVFYIAGNKQLRPGLVGRRQQ